MPTPPRNRRLGALLTESHWNAADLAKAVRGLGAAQGLALRYDRTAVAHWLTGTLPRHPVPELVAAALSERIGRLVTVRDTGLTRSPQAPPLPESILTEDDPVRRLLNLCRTETDPERRAFLARTAFTLTSTALTPALPFPAGEAAATPPAPLPRPRRPGAPAVGACDVSALEEMTQTFAALSARHGGAHVRAMLAAYLDDQVGRLLNAPTARPLRADLLAGAAQLTHLLAGMNDESGRPGLGQGYFRTALDLARQADSPRLYAITLRAMSAQALRLGHPRHARDLAAGAVRVLPAHADPATQSFLLVQHAHTLAVTGDRRRALADLAAAERLHERAGDADGPFRAYPRAGLDYQRAQTLLALGDTPRALAALESSVRHRTPAQRRTHALTRARLAQTLLGQGHVEAGTAHGHLFLDDCPHLHSVHIDTALGQLAERLARFPRQPEAVRLLTRVTEFTGGGRRSRSATG
ncbi:hypothetical protein ACN20G_28930 (plasmid) [Streptomyces sp. BI20]|uniref:hypothetical protein n=1 Tax=Streptomyces sp. BI20 TaxID=3403460 RepID=UPI003C78305E